MAVGNQALELHCRFVVEYQSSLPHEYRSRLMITHPPSKPTCSLSRNQPNLQNHSRQAKREFLTRLYSCAPTRIWETPKESQDDDPKRSDVNGLVVFLPCYTFPKILGNFRCLVRWCATQWFQVLAFFRRAKACYLDMQWIARFERRFCGLRSRWTIDHPWRCSRAISV